MNTVSNYLSALREAMKAQGLDALVIPSADPTYPNTCPSIGRRGANCQALPARSAHSSLPPMKRAYGWTAAIGNKPPNSFPAAALSCKKRASAAVQRMARGKPARKRCRRHPSDMVSLTGKRTLAQSLAAKTSASNTPTTCLTKCGQAVPLSPPKPCSSTTTPTSPKPPPRNSPACAQLWRKRRGLPLGFLA